MIQILEAVRIALQSIWANKLRSFMMVLGNIVAVMSIIAVVSLIQGMNTYVGDAIVGEVGAGTFRVDRTGVTTSEEDEERVRRNPRITLLDKRALERSSPLFQSVMAESGSQANVTYRDITLENVRVRGVSAEYQDFTNFAPMHGRHPTRLEVERNRPVAFIGFETAEKLFKSRSPVDQAIEVGGSHFRVIGVAEKKGSLFGQSQDDFVLIPLGKLMQLFGTRR